LQRSCRESLAGRQIGEDIFSRRLTPDAKRASADRRLSGHRLMHHFGQSANATDVL